MPMGGWSRGFSAKTATQMSLTLPSIAPDTENAPQSAPPARRRDLELTENVFRSIYLIAAVLAIGLILGAGIYGLSHSNRR